MVVSAFAGKLLLGQLITHLPPHRDTMFSNQQIIGEYVQTYRHKMKGVMYSLNNNYNTITIF